MTLLGEKPNFWYDPLNESSSENYFYPKPLPGCKTIVDVRKILSEEFDENN